MHMAYVRNKRNGEIHRVMVDEKGHIVLSGERCQLDDLREAAEPVADNEALLEIRSDPALACGHCIGQEDTDD